ncbi:phage tail tape measure protein [Shewanella sp.]|uniref:phage tail tape measure protein n=1 Tax=Shewanella sp. TaxID=50422 RepID=UPI001EB92763|nr:phage tail tape measure protein [Shewanella sp.]NRB24034.1 phage tail tape measure protein [Shewanella sp.]
MSLPKPLMFTVGLVDQITKPIAKITQQFSGLASNYQAGTMQMATGVGGIAAAGYALQSALMPAIEIDRKLGNLKGLGVTDEALKAVTATAFDFSLQYGKAATDVLDHTAKLRAAMGDMPVHVMQSATASSATLAMVMKSDADTVTKYFKTLYGNNKGQADAMGQDKFIEKITGMTAMAKQLFGTSMADMEGMADGMHSLTSTMGVSMEEQFAVLGMLSQSMGQGDAVTQYTNYLEGVAGAQEKLGVKLTDSKGDLLPIIDVIEKIKPMIEGMSGLDARTFLDDAGLGDGALAIINMSKDLDSLKTNIDSFKNIKGMGPAEKMAKDMTDQSERLSQSWFVIRAAFGSAVLPAFNQFVGWIADMGKQIIWFTQTFPNLTRVLGYGAIAILGLVAAGGAFTVMMGVGKMAMTAYGVAAMAWAGINAVLTSGMAGLRGMMLAVNLAMYANPIGLVVAGIAALIGVIGLAVYYFDDLRNMMSGTAWGEPILFAIDAIADLVKTLGGIALSVFGSFFSIVATVFNALKPLASFLLDVVVFALKLIGGVCLAVFGAIAYGIGALVNGLTLIVDGLAWIGTGIGDAFTAAFNFVGAGWAELVATMSEWGWVQGLVKVFKDVWASLKSMVIDFLNFMIGNINMLPGIDIDLIPNVDTSEATKAIDSIPKQVIPEFIQNHNQQAVPAWMQQTAANDAANAAPMNGPWLNAPAMTNPVVQATGDNVTRLPVEQNQLSPMVPESLMQTVDLQGGQLPTVSTQPMVQPVEIQRDQLPLVAAPSLIQTVEMQRSALSPYQPEAMTQQLDIKPVANESMANAIKPRINQQAAMSAKASRAASQSNSKSLSFGDVIIKHPPKNFSLAEIADQQELMTG